MALDGLTAARKVMRDAGREFRPDELTPAGAAAAVEAAAELEKLAVGIRLRALPQVEDTSRRGRTSR